jgi:hypothetical protein
MQPNQTDTKPPQSHYEEAPRLAATAEVERGDAADQPAPVDGDGRDVCSDETNSGGPEVKTIVIAGVTYRCPYANEVPPPHPEDREALRTDIAQRGVQLPVLLDEHNNVIDGVHRLEITAELGRTDLPQQVVTGLTDQQKRCLARDLNYNRRHLSREDLRAEVKRCLREDPGRSNRSIAAQTNVDKNTVGKERKQLESTGEIHQLDQTRGNDGKTRRRSKRKSRPAPSPAVQRGAEARTDEPLADAGDTATETPAPPAPAAEASQPVTDFDWGRVLIRYGDLVINSGTGLKRLGALPTADQQVGKVRAVVEDIRRCLEQLAESLPAEAAPA